MERNICFITYLQVILQIILSKVAQEKNFIVYQASAGSGKTYTLVKEYLRIVLPQPEKYRRILAVTFTNKAAYEMKSRIIEYLQFLSNIGEAGPETHGKYAPLIQSLIKDTHLTQQLLSERAAIVLEKILHNYSDFAICTIDSFVQRIIRTFAFDLKIPQNFTVELDTEKILSQAVDLLLSYAGVDASITEVLVEFIKQKISDEKNWDVEADLKSFSNELLKENTRKYISLFDDFTMDDFRKIINQTYTKLQLQNKEAKAIASKVVAEITQRGLDDSCFYHGKSGIFNFFQKVVKGGLSNAGINSYHTATVEEGKWFSGSATTEAKQAIDSLKEIISDGFHQISDAIKPYKDLKVVSQMLFPLSLLNLIKVEVDALKAEGNLIFISDFYSKINEQLLNEPVPFIYQRTGEVFEHFFIDEFQDTSILQFQNMLPLIDNSMAAGNSNFIVGDGKQAIYRWRNGEVRQFSNLPDVFNKPDSPHFDDFENSLRRNFTTYQDYNPETRLVNYRSQREIVNFNNELFTFLNQKVQGDEFQKIYHHLVQEVKPGNDGGYVSLRFIEEGSDYEENQLSAVLDLVQQLIDQGTELNRIAVICRKNREAAAIAVRLLSESIDVVSSESLMLKSSARVNFMVSLLRAMHNPADNLAVANVLIFFHSQNVRDLSLHDFLEGYRSLHRDKPPLQALQEILKRYETIISFHLLSSFSLYDLNEELLRIFSLNSRPDPFIIFYLETVNEFVKNQSADLSGFLEWWDEYGIRKSITVPEGLNAVRIMTIHKAKGQEFPIVIYPFADEDTKVKDAMVWQKPTASTPAGLPAIPVQLSRNMLSGSSLETLYQEEKEKVVLDMLNIAYVALTRAEEQLYIISKKYRKPDSEAISFGRLLPDFLKQKGLWSDQQLTYELGTKTSQPNATTQTTAAGLTLQQQFSANWFRRILIRPESALLWDQTPAADKLLWGNIIHEVLSLITTAADLPQVLARQVTAGIIPADQANKVSDYISRMLADPRIQAFFAPGRRIATEAEILTPDNHLYRPDRILFGPALNTIIDFKTGRPSQEHHRQIRNYGLLTTQITNRPSEMFLIYLLEEVKVEEVR